jgi:cytochrome c556
MNARKLLVALTGLGLASAVWAATPADTITARQNNFKAIGRANKSIQDELRKDAPDLVAVVNAATVLDRLAPGIRQWFPNGTGPQSGIKTEAAAAIWLRRAEFEVAAGRAARAAADLKTAANSRNPAQIRTAAMAVGGTCKGCHDTFREKH